MTTIVGTRTVGVRELKEQAPRLVQRAEQGERIVIKRHGKAAAVLGPGLSESTGGGGRRRWAEWERERSAFERLRESLPRALHGHFVAVTGGAVVDSDPDATKLFRRVARRLGGRAFFIGRVAAAEPVVDMPGFTVE
jgi:antitoxin (DNA-binding transcriptional repressor) of toxin-antitoxin stability system